MSLVDKVIVVTGGATGLGRYIALGAAERGAHVAICDMDAEAVRAVEQELSATGRRVLAVDADVRDEAAVAAFMARTAAELSGIDYLVNNAAIVTHFQWGMPRWPRVRDMDYSFWTNILATNVHGTFLATKYAIPYLEKRGGGHIVHVHGGGPVSPPGALAYAVSKEAAVVFVRYLAEEVRGSNICVMSIGPGGRIATERAPAEARARLDGPEVAGERYFLAADAGMELSGHLVDLVDEKLVAIQ